MRKPDSMMDKGRSQIRPNLQRFVARIATTRTLLRRFTQRFDFCDNFLLLK
jgi:hypothetical protein